MSKSVVWKLILKDWWLHSSMIILAIAGGIIALVILLMGGETPTVLGGVFFFIVLCFLACLLPISNIVNEKKKQNLPFLMSLPISSVEYTTAKLISTVGMFLAPWLTLIAAGVLLITVRHVLPLGIVPQVFLVAGLPFIGFSLITGAAIVGESEGWSTAALAIVNSSYWLAWYLLTTHFPELTRDWNSKVLVWSPAVLTMLAGEFALIVLILGFTYYLQSRKRSFI
jgi:ABC-2 type transport system permease protein